MVNIIYKFLFIVTWLKASLNDYTKVAESNSNATYSSQLTQLQTAYNNLSELEKRRSILVNGNTFLRCFNTSTGIFGSLDGNGTYISTVVYNIVNAKASINRVGTGANYADVSSTTNSGSLILYKELA